jgi:hypothetical protein
MKYEIVNQAASIASGIVVLSAAQAKHRLQNLKDLGKDRYEIVNPVQFKIGEVIGYEGDLPKNMAADFLSEKDKAAQKAGAEKAKAAAAANDGPTVADLKTKLDAIGIQYDSKAKKAELQDLLAYAEKVFAKALELSGLDQAAFDALSADDRKPHFEVAEKALAG